MSLHKERLPNKSGSLVLYEGANELLHEDDFLTGSVFAAGHPVIVDT